MTPELVSLKQACEMTSLSRTMVNRLRGEGLIWPCEGLRSAYDAMYAAEAGIPREHARIELLASSLDGITPERLDTIVIEGEWFRIVDIERDGANVLFVCQCAQIPAS